MTSMDRWVGKVALVTGASAGIGSSTAVTLANLGLKVVAVARRVEKIEDLKKLVKGQGELHAVKCDVVSEDDITKTFEWVKKKFGAIHILINNAGIARPGSLTEQDPKFIREVLNVNVVGLTLCTQQALKLMKAAGVDDGHIIHINSIAGHYVPSIMAAELNVYPASKFAVTALTETLRQELRQLKSKIRVTSISPGAVATEIGEAAAKAVGKELSAEMKKLMLEMELKSLESQDIADAIVYVLSTPARVQVHEIIIRPIMEVF